MLHGHSKTPAGSYGMFLAKRGGLVTSTTDASSVTRYSHAASELSAAAPSHAAWFAPMGSSGLALSPEAGTHGGCIALDNTHRTDQGGIFEANKSQGILVTSPTLMG